MKPLILVEEEPFLTRNAISKYAGDNVIIWGEGKSLHPHINVYFALEGDAMPNHVYVLDKLDKRKKAVKQCDVRYLERLTQVGDHGKQFIACKDTRSKVFRDCDRYLGIFYSRIEQMANYADVTFPKLGEHMMRDVVEDLIHGRFDFVFDSNIFGLLYYARRVLQDTLSILHGNHSGATNWQLNQAKRLDGRKEYLMRLLSATYRVERMIKAGMLDNSNAMRYMQLWCENG